MGATAARRAALAGFSADPAMKHAMPGRAKPLRVWAVPSPRRLPLLQLRPSRVSRRCPRRQFRPERSRRRQPSRRWRHLISLSQSKQRLIRKAPVAAPGRPFPSHHVVQGWSPQ